MSTIKKMKAKPLPRVDGDIVSHTQRGSKYATLVGIEAEKQLHNRRGTVVESLQKQGELPQIA